MHYWKTKVNAKEDHGEQNTEILHKDGIQSCTIHLPCVTSSPRSPVAPNFFSHTYADSLSKFLFLVHTMLQIHTHTHTPLLLIPLEFVLSFSLLSLSYISCFWHNIHKILLDFSNFLTPFINCIWHNKGGTNDWPREKDSCL